MGACEVQGKASISIQHLDSLWTSFDQRPDRIKFLRLFTACDLQLFCSTMENQIEKRRMLAINL
jgi:hypothetical protein